MSWSPRDRPRWKAPTSPRVTAYPSLYTIAEVGEDDGAVKSTTTQVGPSTEEAPSKIGPTEALDIDDDTRPQAAQHSAAEAATTPTQAEQPEVVEMEMDSVPAPAEATPTTTDIVKPYPYPQDLPWRNVRPPSAPCGSRQR